MLAAFAIVSSALGAAIEVFSIRHIDKKLDQEAAAMRERGTMGEQFGDWLLFRESEDLPSNLEIVAAQAGQAYAKSMRMSSAAEKSGDVRHQQAIESRVMEAVKENLPGSEAMYWLERLGLSDMTDPEDIKHVIAIVKRLGLENLLGSPKTFGNQRFGNDGLGRA